MLSSEGVVHSGQGLSSKEDVNTPIDPWLLDQLICPVDKSVLTLEKRSLHCPSGHCFPVVGGIAVLLNPAKNPEVDIPPLTLSSLEKLFLKDIGTAPVDTYVQNAICATNGIMYHSLIGKLDHYPIPNIPLPLGAGKVLLDVGCNWGRWSVAASRQQYRVIGMDPNPEAVFAAGRVARKLGVNALFVAADARYLPFKSHSIDQIFSYSVLQHFARHDVHQTLRELSQVLKPGGGVLIEMANRYGLRSFYHQMRRGFTDGSKFDVRYWSPFELRKTWEENFGPSKLIVDGFFSLNPQPQEAHLLPKKFQWVVKLSELVKRISLIIKPIQFFADSLYVQSVKRVK